MINFPFYTQVEAASVEEALIGAKVEIWNAGKLKYQGIPYSSLKVEVYENLKPINKGMVYVAVKITVD